MLLRALALLLALLGTVAATDGDAAILRRLRQTLHDSGTGFAMNATGWMPGDAAHPCEWERVKCNRERRVTHIKLFEIATAGGAACSHPAPFGAALALPPKLAQLEELVQLGLQCASAELSGGIPAAWLQPGAFPRLQELTLGAASMGAPLPDIVPGALPALRWLQLGLPHLCTTLPPSWGVSPEVLPSLQHLVIRVRLAGPLPAAWAQGWLQLRYLSIEGFVGETTRPRDIIIKDARSGSNNSGNAEQEPASAAAEPEALQPLPEAWAAGFPALRGLHLGGVARGGPFPPAWVNGGFPSIEEMNLPQNGLTSSLPPQLFSAHPFLNALHLEYNHLTGTLPAAWGASTAVQFLSLANNLLTGPAFPPAWLAPGALPQLTLLSVVNNPGLSGTLPPTLAWRSIKTLVLDGTAVQGSIPAAWCKAPFAGTLESLYVNATRVDPTPPPCAATGTPGLVGRLQIYKSGVSYGGPSSQPSASDDKGQPAALIAALVAALLLAALTAAGLLWLRRRLAQRRFEAGVRLRRRAHHSRDSGGSGGGLEVECALLQNGCPTGRRRHLSALLRAELRQHSTLEMLPVEALPEVLAHRLQLSPRLNHQPGSGATHMERLEADATLLRSKGHINLVDSEWLWSCREAAGHERKEWQWRLPTDSLRVESADLKFVLDAGDDVVELGEGAFAVVYLAQLHGRPVAVKVIELVGGMLSAPAWREVALHRRCAHPHVVSLLGVVIKGDLLLLVMQNLPGGNLGAALQRPEMQAQLRWAARGRSVALDVAEVLAFLHGEMGVLHGDIKPSNVLLSADCRGYVADLGLSQAVGASTRPHLGGTSVYAAPEQLLGEKCTLAADLFSFGVLLIALLTQAHIPRRGMWRLPVAPAECPPGVVALIQECTRADPLLRPSAAEVLRRLRES